MMISHRKIREAIEVVKSIKRGHSEYWHFDGGKNEDTHGMCSGNPCKCGASEDNKRIDFVINLLQSELL